MSFFTEDFSGKDYFKKIFQKPTKKYILTTTSTFDIIFS